MSDPKSAAAMLRTAQFDIKALRVMLDPDEVAEATFGCHVQQTIEKSLKAWLALLGGRYPFTYDLGLLLALVQKQDDASGFRSLVGIRSTRSSFATRLWSQRP